MAKESSIELSLEEVIDVIKQIGFKILVSLLHKRLELIILKLWRAMIWFKTEVLITVHNMKKVVEKMKPVFTCGYTSVFLSTNRALRFSNLLLQHHLCTAQ